jgi:hypothetical protein
MKPEILQYERVWNAVFHTRQWLNSGAATSANIVLIGADLDLFENADPKSKRAQLLLTAFDSTGDLQYEESLLSSSLRGLYNSPEKAVSNELELTIGRFDVPEILGKDFRYLFSENHSVLQTKYCYYNDPHKRIRTVGPHDIKGIGGEISKVEDLEPIFLLNLYPPNQEQKHTQTWYGPDEPEQFIFRNFGGPSFYTGDPPLIEGMKSENGDKFNGFTFIKAHHESYRRKERDWVTLAEQASHKDCRIITTS